MRILFVLISAISISLLSITPAVSGEVTPQEASQHIGEYATVVGTVAQVSRSRGGTTFVNFGGRFPNHIFYAVIFKKYAGKFPDIGRLAGREIAINGKIELYKGNPQIILFSTEQLELR